jgi:predicted NAD/FAD-dependent oxidoreductase
VERLGKDGDLYKIGEETFTHLVLTPPIPQTAQLLWTIDESRPIANAKYRPCLSVLLGYNLDTPEVDYHALLDPTQSHPLTWLSIENLKSPGRMEDGKTALVAQLSSRFSQENFAKDDEWIVQAVTSFIGTLYGTDWKTPAIAVVKKWKYSQPDNLARFENVNSPGSRLLIAGDGLMGGRIDEAFEAGARVADLILGRSNP